MALDFPIIRKLGGRDAVVTKLHLLGHKTTRDAARMWAARGTIPGDVARLMMRAAESEGIEYGAGDFELEEESEDAHQPIPKTGTAR